MAAIEAFTAHVAVQRVDGRTGAPVRPRGSHRSHSLVGVAEPALVSECVSRSRAISAAAMRTVQAVADRLRAPFSAASSRATSPTAGRMLDAPVRAASSVGRAPDVADHTQSLGLRKCG